MLPSVPTPVTPFKAVVVGNNNNLVVGGRFGDLPLRGPRVVVAAGKEELSLIPRKAGHTLQVRWFARGAFREGLVAQPAHIHSGHATCNMFCDLMQHKIGSQLYILPVESDQAEDAANDQLHAPPGDALVQAWHICTHTCNFAVGHWPSGSITRLFLSSCIAVCSP